MSLVYFLVAEDNEKSSNSIKSLLEIAFSNLRVDTALSNAEVLDKLNSNHYDVVLYDLGMDIDDNYPIAHKIKDEKPGVILIGASLAMDLARRHEVKKSSNCFDELKSTIDIMQYYKTVIPDILKKYGVVVERRYLPHTDAL